MFNGHLSPVQNTEAFLMFGKVEQLFLCHLYNLRVTYPNLEIFIATADIKACFCFPRICPDLACAFGFFAGKFYCLATAMVFGSNPSATSWEPFRRVIKGLSVVYANCEDLIENHANYLDMIDWDLQRTTTITKAVPCVMNPGILDKNGDEIPEPARFYVDDALIVICGVMKMKMALAAVIEAIFSIMGHGIPRYEGLPVLTCPRQVAGVGCWAIPVGVGSALPQQNPYC